VREVLRELIRQLEAANGKPDQEALKAWWAQIEEWRSRDCLKYDRASTLIKPQFVIEKLYEVTKGQAFVTSDVGQHQMWAAQFYNSRSRGAGSIPAVSHDGLRPARAMGVQLAHPKDAVAA